jgi:hypothetical protein
VYGYPVLQKTLPEGKVYSIELMRVARFEKKDGIQNTTSSNQTYTRECNKAHLMRVRNEVPPMGLQIQIQPSQERRQWARASRGLE